MADIHQGDQYTLPFKIYMPDGTLVTSSNVDGVRIKIDTDLKYYPGGGVTYDSTNQEWLYPLTEDQTQALDYGRCPAQVGIKSGSEFIYSDTFYVLVGRSIIEEDWNA